MKKILSVIILLSCIVPNIFALSARVIRSDFDHVRTIVVYDNDTKVLEYSRPLVFVRGRIPPLGRLYAISWYKKDATAEQIKEWKEFAKLFVEEE